MNSMASFMLEATLVNSAPIFLAAFVFALIAGPFLKNAGAGKYWRIAIYSLIGVGAGLFSLGIFGDGYPK